MAEMCGKDLQILNLAVRPCIRVRGHKGTHTADLTGLVVGNITFLQPERLRHRAAWRVRQEDGLERVLEARNIFNKTNRGLRLIHGWYGPEYKTVHGHWRMIFGTKGYPTYKDMPFFDEWNPNKNGAIWKGAKWVIENLGRKPGTCWSLDIIEHDKGFVPGNLRWALKNEQARNKQHRKLGYISDEEFAVEAQRRGYIRVPDLTVMRLPTFDLEVYDHRIRSH